MADKKNVPESQHDEMVIAKAKDFWSKYSKQIITVSLVVFLAVGGWFVYKNFFKEPKEAKAKEAIFKAEEYYRMDSINLALNGDGQHDGFLKIISKYKGTDAANLANFYAGSCYLKLNENEKAVTYLKKFSTSSKSVQARAYKLLGDAYAEQGKNNDALSYYKKAAYHYEADASNSAEYLLYAAYLADRVIKDTKSATALYKEIVDKYPGTPQSDDAERYLAQLGVYDTN